MKKINWLFFASVVLATSVFVGSCNTEEEDPNDPGTPPNVLCDGAGSSSYFPLAADNEWTYSGQFGTTETVTDVATVSAGTEYTLDVDQGFTDWTETYVVGSNGDVFFESAGVTVSDSLYLYVPANPTVNQEWLYVISFDGHKVRKVVSTNASVSTSSCDYTGCLEIQEYDGTGDALGTYWYKPGVGQVKQLVLTSSNLTSVTLN